MNPQPPRRRHHSRTAFRRSAIALAILALVPMSGAHAQGSEVPPLKDRGVPEQQTPSIAVLGFAVSGVADHVEVGITPEGVQSLADAEFARLAAGAAAGEPVLLTFAQMQEVADRITETYKAAGYFLSRAVLPAQTIGEDRIVRIDMLEGRLSKVIVKNNKRYSESALLTQVEPLIDRPLRKQEVEEALLYASDLPGLSVSSTFQPGEATGETELVLLANEGGRPFVISVGNNNFGNSFTGRYRAQAGLTWNSPFGVGDRFSAVFEYAYSPQNNIFGAIDYRLPIAAGRGLGLLVGYTRNQLQINSGALAALGLNGPSTNLFGGLEWKFVNTTDLKVTANLLGTYETSRLDSALGQFSNDRVSVLSSTLIANHTDKRFKGVNVIDVGVRKSLTNDSAVSVAVTNDEQFVLAKLGLTRLQFLSKTQRLIGKLQAQYTNDALIPIEQFGLGGPESVRAYPIVDVLNDRGFFTTLEYHVDAPFFAESVSPFYGRPWREVLEFELFADYGIAQAAGQHRDQGFENTSTRSGVGGGFIFRVPRFYNLQLHMTGAVPLSSAEASDGNDYHIYGQIGFSF